MIRALEPALAAALILLPEAAARGGLDGRALGFAWALPFVGHPPVASRCFRSWRPMPGSITRARSRRSGRSSSSSPWRLIFGPATALHALAHTALLEYIPFILLLLALFTVAGGILIRGNIHGAPVANTVLLAIGTVLASLIGTTGASMVMIRPVHARQRRPAPQCARGRVLHLPGVEHRRLADAARRPAALPRLPARRRLLLDDDAPPAARRSSPARSCSPSSSCSTAYLYRKEGRIRPDPTPDKPGARHRRRSTSLLIAVIIGAILMSATVDLGRVHGARHRDRGRQRCCATSSWSASRSLSLALTPKANRAENGFSWGPIEEVAKLFAGIFITIIPVLAMLRGRPRRRLRAARRAGLEPGRQRQQRRLFLARPAACRRSSTTRRPTWSSSSSPAAIRSS